jgi:xanthine dehydrogenase accessory factor
MPGTTTVPRLRAACEPGFGLCTIVGIEGSFSRRARRAAGGASDGRDHRQPRRRLPREAAGERDRRGHGPVVKRFGAGSELIDFRLPCGSGLDVLVDPAPDHRACRAVAERLDAREEATLPLPCTPLPERRYIPAPRLQLFGEGPELEALVALARIAGIETEAHGKDALSLGRRPAGLAADPWTAVVLLFHDHEWEQAILEWALATPAFLIGAQGGFEARRARIERLAQGGAPPDQIGRVRSPVGPDPAQPRTRRAWRCRRWRRSSANTKRCTRMGKPLVAVLAAGRGTRFGGGKLEAICAGKPLGRWALDAVADAGLAPGVNRDRAARRQLCRGLARAVQPPTRTRLGLLAGAGAQAALDGGASTLLVLLADMPLVTPDYLRRLAAASPPAATRQPDGHAGVPALLDRALLARKPRAWPGDRGAGALLTAVPGLAHREPPAGMLRDVDTQEDLAEVARALASP